MIAPIFPRSVYRLHMEISRNYLTPQPFWKWKTISFILLPWKKKQTTSSFRTKGKDL